MATHLQLSSGRIASWPTTSPRMAARPGFRMTDVRASHDDARTSAARRGDAPQFALVLHGDTLQIDLINRSVSIIGRFGRISDQLLALGQRYSYRRMVLNLANTEYVAAQFLGQLSRLHQAACKANCEFRLCGLQQRVRQLIQVTELERVLVICGSLDEAIRG